MESVARLSALVALFALLVAGCGKDTVSNPAGGAGLAAQGAPEGGSNTIGNDSTDAPATQQGSNAAVTRTSDSGAASSTDPQPRRAGSDEILLRVNVKKGQRFTYELTTSGDAMGQKLVTTMTVTGTVLDATDDKYVVEYKFEDATVSTSNATVKNSLEQQMSSMKNTTIIMDVDKLGRMSNPRGEGAETFKAMGGGSAFGFDSGLPENPIKVGDTWTQSRSLPGLGGDPMKVTYKLVAVSGTVATITSSGTHSMQFSRPGGQQGGASMSIKAEFSTTIKLDVDTGMVIEMDGTTTTTFGGGSAPTTTQQLTIKLRRK